MADHFCAYADSATAPEILNLLGEIRYVLAFLRRRESHHPKRLHLAEFHLLLAALIATRHGIKQRGRTASLNHRCFHEQGLHHRKHADIVLGLGRERTVGQISC